MYVLYREYLAIETVQTQQQEYLHLLLQEILQYQVKLPHPLKCVYREIMLLLFVFELSIILTFLIFKNGFDDWKKSLKK